MRRLEVGEPSRCAADLAPAQPGSSLPGLVAYRGAGGPSRQRRWLELRVARRGRRPRRRFVSARQPGAAAAASVLARAGDVYAGALPRAQRAGGRAAVPDGCTVWAELDDQAALERLAAFEPQPAIAIRSGTAGHLHAYWLLDRPLAAGALERANRRLAHGLGGDGRCVDAARALRLL